MPYWISNLCERFVGFWLAATPNTYSLAIVFIAGLGWVAGRARG